MNMETNSPKHILIVEPFHGGSHKQLVDLLQTEIPGCDVYTLPAKKWHWRARTSALYFAQTIPVCHQFTVLFCSSVLALAELIALRPDLAELRKVVYFHENQLVYPVQKQQERDFQYGYNQILTVLVADVVVFNSQYNQESFLTNISSFIKLIPDHRPRGLAEQIRPKCQVVYFPIHFARLPAEFNQTCKQSDNDQDYINRPNSESCDKTDEEKIGPCLGSDQITENCDRVATNTTDSVSRTDKPIKQSESGKEYQGRTDTPSVHSLDTVKVSDTGGLKKAKLDSVELSPCGTEGSSKTCNQITASNDSLHVSVGKHIVTSDGPLVIAWSHRWEHDKNPDLFFRTLYKLQEEGLQFRVVVMGEAFTDVPAIFAEAKATLKDHSLCWGYQETKTDYYRVLQDCDVAVSTAKHEFFGVAMLEAVYFRCYPLAPQDLVYPEIFPKECLYNTENQLLKKLRQFCQRPKLVRARAPVIDVWKYSWQRLQAEYETLLDHRDKPVKQQAYGDNIT